MSIDSLHPLYEQHAAQWKRCRIAYEGEDAVKAAGEEYLPKVSPDQTKAEYAAYLRRALYYEAVGRTIDGFTGAISRKPHTIELPGALKVFEDDATAEGVALDEFIKTLCAETILQGRGGVLVDYDDTIQPAGRAYLKLYRTETITNWTADSVVLRETVYEADAADPLKQVAVEQIRQLHMDGARYTVTIWRKSTQAAQTRQEWVVASTVQPTRRGAAITELPWIWLSCMGRTARVEKPPLLGLVNVAMSHYRTSADLEHGRHFCGMPTLWVAGMPNSDEPLRIGAGAAILLDNPEAKVGYAEFTGQGLASLETAMDKKEQMMAVLGAAVFNTGKKGVEAAETARIRTAGENNLLMGTVSAVEETLEAALTCAAQWMAASGTVAVKLNRDFIDQSIDAQTLAGMVAAYQAGAMSLQTFLYNLQQAEMLPPEMDIEAEAAKLTADAAKKAADAAKLAQQAKTLIA